MAYQKFLSISLKIAIVDEMDDFSKQEKIHK